MIRLKRPPAGMRSSASLREQFRRTIATLGRDDTELRHMPTDRVRQHRALADQELATAMEHQGRLLLLRFRRHKPHQIFGRVGGSETEAPAQQLYRGAIVTRMSGIRPFSLPGHFEGVGRHRLNPGLIKIPKP